LPRLIFWRAHDVRSARSPVGLRRRGFGDEARAAARVLAARTRANRMNAARGAGLASRRKP
jgi:hypothetical protein